MYPSPAGSPSALLDSGFAGSAAPRSLLRLLRSLGAPLALLAPGLLAPLAGVKIQIYHIKCNVSRALRVAHTTPERALCALPLTHRIYAVFANYRKK